MRQCGGCLAQSLHLFGLAWVSPPQGGVGDSLTTECWLPKPLLSSLSRGRLEGGADMVLTQNMLTGGRGTPGPSRQRCLSDTHSNSLTFAASETACPENVIIIIIITMGTGEDCLVPLPQVAGPLAALWPWSLCLLTLTYLPGGTRA